MAEPAGKFAAALRALRARARLTQEELADAAGLSRRTVSDLERGVATTPQQETVGMVARQLHHHPAWTAAGLGGVLLRHGRWADDVARQSAAVQAARHLGDRPGQASALIDLGNAWRLTENNPAAAQALDEALGLSLRSATRPARPGR
jgi:transcriptional regulator with XRE-family HTH domain